MQQFTDAIIDGFKRSFDVRGRSTRPQYWYFALFQFLSSIVLALMSLAFAPAILLYVLFALITLPASFTIPFRRVRDAGGPVLLPLAPLGIGIVSGYAAPSGNDTLMGVVAMAYLVSVVALFIYLVRASRHASPS